MKIGIGRFKLWFVFRKNSLYYRGFYGKEVMRNIVPLDSCNTNKDYTVCKTAKNIKEIWKNVTSVTDCGFTTFWFFWRIFICIQTLSYYEENKKM